MPARRRFAAASLAAVATCTTTAAYATDKVRCTAAYEQSQVLRRQDKLSASRAQLLICEETCTKALAADCTKWRAEVDALMPTVRLRASDGHGHPVEARVLVDGTLLLDHLQDDPVAVDSGDHTFRFETTSGLSTEIHASLHGGERAREIDAVLAPAPPPDAPSTGLPPVPTTSYVLGGVGGVGLVLAAVLSLKGHLDESNLRSTCAPACAPSDVDSVRTLYDVGWVSGGIGVVALAVGVVVWHPWGTAAAAPTEGVFVVPTIGGARVGWTFR